MSKLVLEQRQVLLSSLGSVVLLEKLLKLAAKS